MVSKRQQKHPLPGCPGEPKDGLNALKKADQNKLNLNGLVPTQSVDIDLSFKKLEPNDARWDYFIDIQRMGELYVEVHEVSEGQFDRLLLKAAWLRKKIAELGWPDSGRPLLIAPTAGISPFSLFGDLSKRLAEKKISIVRKGDPIASHFD